MGSGKNGFYNFCRQKAEGSLEVKCLPPLLKQRIDFFVLKPAEGVMPQSCFWLSTLISNSPQDWKIQFSLHQTGHLLPNFTTLDNEGLDLFEEFLDTYEQWDQALIALWN